MQHCAGVVAGKPSVTYRWQQKTENEPRPKSIGRGPRLPNGIARIMIPTPPIIKDVADVNDLMKIRHFLESSGDVVPAVDLSGIRLLAVIEAIMSDLVFSKLIRKLKPA